MTDKVELPQTIAILSPRPSGILPRGRNALKGADPQRNFRCPDDKWKSVQEACELLGMNTAEFARWVTYAAANSVLLIAQQQKVVPTPVKIKIQEKKEETIIPIRKVSNPYGLK